MSKSESQLQSDTIKFLKKHGCFVFKVQAGAGVPVGTPDVFFCKEGFWGFAEIKSSKSSKFQPLQKDRISMLNSWSWCKVIYPENYADICVELSAMLG